MSQSICPQCRATKIGALTPCLRCGFDPQTPREQAQSLLLSDHDLGDVSLDELTEQLSGIDMKQMEAETRRAFRSCLALTFLIFFLFLGVAALIFYFLT